MPEDDVKLSSTMAEIEAYCLNMVGDAVRDLLDPQRIVNGDQLQYAPHR